MDAPPQPPKDRDGPIAVSVVVPIYNERESLPVLHGEIAAAMTALGQPWEVLYVDDGSTDGSLGIMLGLREVDPHIRIVKFRRNYGQTAGLGAGFDHARGAVVVTLDGDLQNDPADIPRLLERVHDGYDIVAGWRKRREDGFILRRLPSIIANRLIAWFTGVSIHDTGCTLKAFRRELVRSLSIYADQHRFLPVLSAGRGARVTEMVVNHRPRRFGVSKYGLSRAVRVLFDLMSIKLVTQFSQRPLHYFGLLSMTFAGLGLFFASVGLISFQPDPDLGRGDGRINRWEWMVITVLMMVFCLVVFYALLGLLSELVVKASGMHRRGILNRILNELH
ncbi:glycosyltransferase family 2 protein [Engelhardtia mirabilis]|uniref:Undecaprenyl-phosphate 4-deoxy-4-formamido-L-arabinose transferase n=1 Tax=Engelhardtia mirabilis TaxID=2528011 RepID=A0A518BKE2_9BACT|nr:Undecaprenyl-phosphate 4-deoxy-4-formamido-L-arabinose transferase [Planctomycetes bacterium Pla133]QDV01761.1 Undecaprenyl-phosphate 4-deoxy-4-formamido-L-arabinose transferase [Planctomycetes bacterium Pla86]